MSGDDRLITVQDVYNAFREHLAILDKLWPEDERFGPRKVHIVELLDAIKLRLIQKAEKNEGRYESPFEKAAAKITGTTPKAPADKPETPPVVGPMREAYEQARTRIRNNSR